MARVLAVIADPVEARLLSNHVESAGHAFTAVLTGQEGYASAKQAPPDLIFLDWAITDIPCSEVLRALTTMPDTRSIPVICLSHKTEEIDRIVGFELGASDYVTRPYSVRELLLRAQAILRRSRPEPQATSLIDLGRLRIDKAAYRVWLDGEELDLTLLELNLLIALYEGRNRVQTRAALLSRVWGMASNVTTRTVDTHVKRLRDKLGPLGGIIETVRGTGYRLANIGSVTRASHN